MQNMGSGSLGCCELPAPKPLAREPNLTARRGGRARASAIIDNRWLGGMRRRRRRCRWHLTFGRSRERLERLYCFRRRPADSESSHSTRTRRHELREASSAARVHLFCFHFRLHREHLSSSSSSSGSSRTTKITPSEASCVVKLLSFLADINKQRIARGGGSARM